MADQLTEALSGVVNNPSFRRDAAIFLSLPKGAVDSLVELVESHGTFDVPASEVLKYEQDCNLEGQGRQVLAAARLIRRAVRSIDRSEDRRQHLVDFAALMNVQPFDYEGFSRFFSELPKLDTEELQRGAIAVGPTVVDSRLYSDLRVISHGPVEDWKFVPVVVARLQFDESVAGQQALFIQLTEESLADLKREIERTEEALRGIGRRFANRSFSEEKNAGN